MQQSATQCNTLTISLSCTYSSATSTTTHTATNCNTHLQCPCRADTRVPPAPERHRTLHTNDPFITHTTSQFNTTHRADHAQHHTTPVIHNRKVYSFVKCIHKCDMSYSQKWHELLTSVTWVIDMRDIFTTTPLMHMREVSQSHVCARHASNVSHMYVCAMHPMCLTCMCAPCIQCVSHNITHPFTWGAWLIHMCDMTHS